MQITLPFFAFASLNTMPCIHQSEKNYTELRTGNLPEYNETLMPQPLQEEPPEPELKILRWM